MIADLGFMASNVRELPDDALVRKRRSLEWCPIPKKITEVRRIPLASLINIITYKLWL